MEIRQWEIEGVIKGVMDEIMRFGLIKEGKEESLGRGIFQEMEEAVKKAKEAQKILFASKLDLRARIIAEIRREAEKYIDELSRMAVEETGMGRIEDKRAKNKLVLEKTPGLEDLKAFAVSGDDGLTVMELSPYGVIGAITPSTNPSETILCNSIGMIAAGNAVVFAPHPSARKTSRKTVEIVNEAIKKAGGPENLVVTVENPSIENTNKLIASEDVQMIVATGGPGIVRAVMSSGKKAIGAGAGNPPVLVDASADIEKAARDIVAGASLDNNLPCIAEKVAVVEDKVKDYLIFEMRKNGAYLIEDKKTIEELEKLVITDGKPNREYVGRDASYILKKLGIETLGDVRLIIFEDDESGILAREEQLMPILPIVEVKSPMEGIEVCKRLEAGQRHTAVIHSKNIDILTKYAREMETTILVKNGPSYSGIGVNGEGHTTFTIAGPTGEGLTSARSFARKRRCTLVGGFSIK